MSSINKVILIGRVGKDVEVKYTASGTPVSRFSLATNEKWKNNGGDAQQHTEWHSIVAFGRLGEICGEYLRKGALCFVEGSIRSGQWEDREGNRRRSFDIVVRQMQMLSSATNGNSRKTSDPSAAKPAPAEEDDNPFRQDDQAESEVPF